MKTIHLKSQDQLVELTASIETMLSDGKTLAITVAEENEQLSPSEAAERLGFSRQHVRRLVDAGELIGEQLPRSNYWKIPMSSILAFEERRERSAHAADTLSAELEELGAPAE